MLNILKRSKEEEVKELIFNEYFSSKKHKKIIKQAAKKSAEDQKRLVDEYRRVTSK